MVQAVVAHGNVDLSSGLMRELLWRDVPIAWCSGTGRLYGWATSSWGPNGPTRVQQHVASSEGRLGIAREFVASKIANQATQLRRAGASPEIVARIQYSVFVADLRPGRFVRLRSGMERLIDAAADSVLLCHLGPAAARGNDALQWIGRDRPTPPSGSLIV